MRLFGKKEPVLTRYVQVPTLYPMGALTFAIACSHCKNRNSEKCIKCKKEIESGFELKEVIDTSANRCVCCGEHTPEGTLICPICEMTGGSKYVK